MTVGQNPNGFSFALTQHCKQTVQNWLRMEKKYPSLYNAAFWQPRQIPDSTLPDHTVAVASRRMLQPAADCVTDPEFTMPLSQDDLAFSGSASSDAVHGEHYHSCALPYLTDSAQYYVAIRNQGWAIWLDSGERNENRGRFDILAAGPVKRLISDQQGSRCETPSDSHAPVITRYANAWEALSSELEISGANLPGDLPFGSGALGYLGYDLGRELEVFEDQLPDPADLPDMLIGIYAWAIVQDHLNQRTTLVWEVRLGAEFGEALARRLNPQLALNGANSDSDERDPGRFRLGDLTSNTSPADYESRVTRIQDYIAAGDCYQVNFAQCYSARYEGDLLQAYRALRQRLPSPFSCFFETELGTVLSLSPERFIHSDGRNVLTQPIKGTAPRGSTPESDRQLAEQLQQSTKDQAENLMIVDLLRNDFSKVCQPHTVLTPKLFDLESYTNVHHLVSSITGVLKPGVTPVELLAACFPGGSITGAPKIRAMEVIEELENTRRSVYCGSIGYIDKSGSMDTNIAIRTIVANRQELFVWGGGGVVADSVPQKEYQESLTKIGVILDTLKAVGTARSFP